MGLIDAVLCPPSSAGDAANAGKGIYANAQPPGIGFL